MCGADDVDMDVALLCISLPSTSQNRFSWLSIPWKVVNGNGVSEAGCTPIQYAMGSLFMRWDVMWGTVKASRIDERCGRGYDEDAEMRWG